MVLPVELQNVLAKTPAAERITQLQKANPENDQRQSIMVGDQKAHEAQRKPTPAVQSDEVILHRDRPKDDKGKSKKEKEQHTKDGTDADGHVKPPDDDGTPVLPPPSLDITV